MDFGRLVNEGFGLLFGGCEVLVIVVIWSWIAARQAKELSDCHRYFKGLGFRV